MFCVSPACVCASQSSSSDICIRSDGLHAVQLHVAAQQLSGCNGPELHRVRVQVSDTGASVRAAIFAPSPGVLNLVAYVPCCEDASLPGSVQGPSSEVYAIPVLVAPNSAVQREMIGLLDSMTHLVQEEQQGQGFQHVHDKQQLDAASMVAWTVHYQQLLLDICAILDCTAGKPGSVPLAVAALLLVAVLEFLSHHACWCTVGWLLAEAYKAGLTAHAKAPAEQRLQQLHTLLAAHPSAAAMAAAAAATALSGLTIEPVDTAVASSPCTSTSSSLGPAGQLRQHAAAAITAATAAAAVRQPAKAAVCSAGDESCSLLGQPSTGSSDSMASAGGSSFASAVCSTPGSPGTSSCSVAVPYSGRQPHQHTKSTQQLLAVASRCSRWLCERGYLHLVLGITVAALLAVLILLQVLGPAALQSCLAVPQQQRGSTPQQQQQQQASGQLDQAGNLGCSVLSVYTPDLLGPATSPPKFQQGMAVVAAQQHWAFGPVALLLLAACFLAGKVCLVV